MGAYSSGGGPERAWTGAFEELPGSEKQGRRRSPPNEVMPANLGNPIDSFPPPDRQSRESGNPVPLPALDRIAESRWVPAFAGMTIKVVQANPELEFRTPAPSPQPQPPAPSPQSLTIPMPITPQEALQRTIEHREIV